MTMLLALAAAFAPVLQEDEKIKEWIEQLTSDYEEERHEARKQLEAVKEKAEPHLIAALGKDDHRVRRACIDLLLAAKSTKAVEPIAKVFKDAKEERTVRQAAFNYLCSVPKESEQHLIDALDTNEEGWKIGALDGLKEINSAKCAEKVATLYDKEANAIVKQKAFDCLQSIGKPAQPYLLKLLASTDSNVRLGALNGLEKIGASNEEILEPVAKIFKTETSDEVLKKSYAVLITGKEKAEPHFVEGLKSAQEGVRLKSIEGIIELKLESAIKPVGECFENDGTDSVRTKAREALESFGLKSEDILFRALENKNGKVRIASINALTAIKSEKPYEKIAEMYSKDPDKDVHALCFAYLEAVPAKAEKQLLLALKDEDPGIRERAIAALGRGKVEAAIEPLIELLGDLNQKIKAAAVDALCRIGPKSIEAVNAGLQSGKVKKAHAESILALYYQDEVEKLLYKLVTKDGGTGYFEGQFKELEAFGKDKAMPVLARIVMDDAYEWRIPESSWKGDQWLHKRYLRELSIIALGGMGDESTTKRLKDYLKDRTYAYEDEEYGHFVVALAKLGDKSLFENFVKGLVKDAEEAMKTDDKIPGFNKLFGVGVVQNRVGSRDEALKTYQRLQKIVEDAKSEKTWNDYRSVLYNIACLYSLGGEKEKSVEFLNKAVDAGFKDREWVEIDRDLEAIRGEAGYKMLLGEAKRWEKTRE